MDFFRLRAAVRKRLLRQPSTLESVCDRHWTLHPAQAAQEPPALYAPHLLERVTACMEVTTMEKQLRRIRGGPIEHGATIAYELSHVDLVRGALYRRGMNYPVRRNPLPARAGGRPTFESGALASTYFGDVFFGHWLTDDLTMHLAAEAIAPPVIVEHTPFHHEAQYRELLDIRCAPVRSAHFGKLIVLFDEGQNAYKRQRYETLRARFTRASPDGRELVYIRRGTVRGAARALTNATELEAYLAAQGFAIVDPDVQSVAQIGRLVSGARVVLGVEGSQLLHGLYGIRADGCFAVIQPPDRFNNVIKNYADCLGVRYAFTVALPSTGGFALPLDDLKVLLDLATRPAPPQ